MQLPLFAGCFFQSTFRGLGGTITHMKEDPPFEMSCIVAVAGRTDGWLRVLAFAQAPTQKSYAAA